MQNLNLFLPTWTLWLLVGIACAVIYPFIATWIYYRVWNHLKTKPDFVGDPDSFAVPSAFFWPIVLPVVLSWIVLYCIIVVLLLPANKLDSYMEKKYKGLDRKKEN